MKPLAYWEEKSKRTTEELGKLHKRKRILEHRYRSGMRKLRCWQITGERVRRRNQIFLARMARLERRKQMYLSHLLYYQQRIEALREFNRFDRARRQPPI